ncbi:MAG: hypothetical protein IT306_27520 [Chloroflexi bacterium]|nr:hypothetical protein [Chloroflexota bacterium]
MAVPSERPDTPPAAAPEPSRSGLPTVASNSDILGWLDILLKGKPEQQAQARTEIAMILEARGHTDDAEEAYWTNVQARAADRRSYERLIALYQERGDRLSETLVQRMLDEVFNPRPAAPTQNPGPAQPGGPGQQFGQQPARRTRRLRSAGPAGADAGTPPAPEPEPAPPAPPAAPTPPPVTATGPGAAAGHAYAAIVHAANLQAAAATPPASAAPTAAPGPAAPSATTARAARPGGPAGTSPASAAPAPQSPAPQARAGQPAATPFVLPPEPARRRPSPLSPHPEPAATGRRFNTSGLIVLQPTTIGAFLLASFGAAAIIAFLLIMTDRGGSRSAASASPAATTVPLSVANGLPARCSDASIRFPGLNLADPRGAVAAGYRENGVDVDATRPGSARLTADQAEQVLGGWMAISLLMERSGQAPPTLTGWLDSETDRPTLANAILAGRRLDGMITADEWATMRGWTATTCEGAFLHDPHNAAATRLMERVVAR